MPSLARVMPAISVFMCCSLPKLFRGRAVLGVTVAVVGKHLLDDLGLEFSVRAFRNLGQIEILDRIAVDVEFEVVAQRGELSLPERGRDGLLFLAGALDRLHR